MEYYAHAEIVFGIIIIFGWRIAKLSFVVYLINCIILYHPRNKIIVGIQIMFGLLLIVVPFTENTLEKGYDNLSTNLEKQGKAKNHQKRS